MNENKLLVTVPDNVPSWKRPGEVRNLEKGASVEFTVINGQVHIDLREWYITEKGKVQSQRTMICLDNTQTAQVAQHLAQHLTHI